MKPLNKIAALTLLASITVAAPSFALQPPETEEQKTLYAVGLIIGRQLDVFSLTPAEFEWVKQGITDKVTGQKAQIELTAYNEKVQALAKERRKTKGEKQAVGDKEFLGKAAAEKGAVKSETGLIYIP